MRAAEWLSEHGRSADAAAYLIAAGEYDRALAAMAGEVTRQLEAGIYLSDPIPPGLDLPEGYLRGDPVRVYPVAAALLTAFAPRDARPLLMLLDDAVRQGKESLAARVEYLWALHDCQMGHADGAVRHGYRTQALLEIDRTPPRLPHSVRANNPWLAEIDASMGTVLPSLIARGHVWRGEFTAARAALRLIPPRSQAVDASTYQAVVAMTAYGEGRLSEALSASLRCLEGDNQNPVAHKAAAFGAHQALAAVLCERDHLDEAEDAAAEALALAAQRPRETQWVASAEMSVFDVLLAQGRRDEAWELLAHVRQLNDAERLPPHIGSDLDAREVLCRLDTGDVPAASAFLEAAPPQTRTPLLRSRIDLRGGRPDRAADRLRAASAPTAGTRYEIERLILLARAQLQLGDHRSAHEAMRRAVELGRTEGYVRVFVDEGPEVAVMLRELQSPYPDAYVKQLLSRMEPADPESSPTATWIVEPLTDREREVLGRLATHLTQHEIASQLYVSVNTVKTHLKGVYRKLGASSRAEAVRIATVHKLL
jgi:LuxR family maltose regulon positive regulatory protein